MHKIKLEIKWALIFVVTMLLWMFLERIAGLHDQYIEWHPVLTNLVAIPALIIYYLALTDKRKSQYSGYMTYNQGFICGLVITLIITALSPATQYITSKFITPDYFDNMIAYTTRDNLMPKEDAEAYFNLKNYIMQSIMFSPVMGLITTAIIAFFTKRKPKD